jgi:hypothetical protein
MNKDWIVIRSATIGLSRDISGVTAYQSYDVACLKERSIISEPRICREPTVTRLMNRGFFAINSLAYFV